ncbi:hypothetical protein EJB05_01541, partial [Eragrostis curvula]
MWPVVVVLCGLVLVLSSSPTSTQAGGGVPIVAPVGKDPSTSLYTVTIKAGGHDLVVDLSGPLHWSRCPPAHRNFPCLSSACQAVNRDIPPGTCTFTSKFINYTDPNCICPTYPYNPITGECGITDATTFTLSATALNGAQQEPVTFMALGACSTELLYETLPADSWGVAGMSRLTQSLPTQVTSTFKLPREFALCLPWSGGGSGAVIFGGGPSQLLSGVAAQALSENQVPYLKSSTNGAYYLHVTGINVNNAPVTLPREGALDLNAGSGEGGVILSTVVSYTTLRSDIYRALLAAFDAATSGVPRAPAVAPFELCFQASSASASALPFPGVDLLLDNGRTWSVASVVQVDDRTACFAFLEMTMISRVGWEPAALLGGFQFEDRLLLFDLEKETFAFSGPLAGGCAITSP